MMWVVRKIIMSIAFVNTSNSNVMLQFFITRTCRDGSCSIFYIPNVNWIEERYCINNKMNSWIFDFSWRIGKSKISNDIKHWYEIFLIFLPILLFYKFVKNSDNAAIPSHRYTIIYLIRWCPLLLYLNITFNCKNILLPK